MKKRPYYKQTTKNFNVKRRKARYLRKSMRRVGMLNEKYKTYIDE